MQVAKEVIRVATAAIALVAAAATATGQVTVPIGQRSRCRAASEAVAGDDEDVIDHPLARQQAVRDSRTSR